MAIEFKPEFGSAVESSRPIDLPQEWEIGKLIQRLCYQWELEGLLFL